MRDVKHGSTDQSVVLRFLNSPDGTPATDIDHTWPELKLYYRREGAAVVQVNPVSLATLATAHADGGIKHMQDGRARVDFPDAAFAAGAAGVYCWAEGNDLQVIGCYVALVSFDPLDNRLGMVGIPTQVPGQDGGLATAFILNGLVPIITQARDMLIATRVVDTNVTPWELVYIKAGTGQLGDEGAVELLRQPLYDTAGNPVTSKNAVIGKALSE